jgi:hypothetical protein
MEALLYTLPWTVGALALFSFLAVSAWSAERRREREAFYKSEAIKRIVEMQGNAPEEVVRALLNTVNAWKEEKPMAPMQSRNYYRAQSLEKVAAAGAGAEALLTFLREEQRNSARRTREGTRLAGLINLAVGLGVVLFLIVVIPEKPIYFAGIIPAGVGVVLIAYSFFSGSND